jgi:putative phage-type endonuclease
MNSKIHKDIEQGSDAWREIRKGKMTGSNAQAIGNNGKGLETYIIAMMAEAYSSGEKEEYTSKHLERGNELEPIARDIYTLQTGNEVEQVGFIEIDEFSGVSPDGLVGDDGLIEIKCIDDVGYFRYLLNGEKEIDSKYIWQVQMGLYATGRKWCDIIIYNPNYEKSMLIFRIYPDMEMFKKLDIGLTTGKQRIIEIKEKLKCLQ